MQAEDSASCSVFFFAIVSGLKFDMVSLRVSSSLCTKFHCPAATLRLCSNLPKIAKSAANSKNRVFWLLSATFDNA